MIARKNHRETYGPPNPRKSCKGQAVEETPLYDEAESFDKPATHLPSNSVTLAATIYPLHALK